MTTITEFGLIIGIFANSIKNIFVGMMSVGFYDPTGTMIVIPILYIFLSIIFFRMIMAFLIKLISEGTEHEGADEKEPSYGTKYTLSDKF